MSRQPWYWVMAVLLWSASDAAAQPRLPKKWNTSLSPGTQKVVTFPREVVGFGVRDEGVIEVRPIGNNQLWIIATNPADTQLVLFGRMGPVSYIDIRVRAINLEMRVCQLCKFLPRDTMIQVGFAEGTALKVSGVAWTLEELRGVKLISQVAPFRVIIDVQLANERPLREALVVVNRELWRQGYLDSRAVVVGDRVQLIGPFANGEEILARATIAPYIEWLEDRLLPIQTPVP
jgi:Flp pilus assembly secretin CpaC